MSNPNNILQPLITDMDPFAKTSEPLIPVPEKGRKTIIFVGMEGWSKKGGQADYIRELSEALTLEGHCVLVINPYFQHPHADISVDKGRETAFVDLPVGQGALRFDIHYNKIGNVHYLRFKDPHNLLFPVVYPDWYVDGVLYSDSLYGYLEAVILSRIPMHIAGLLGIRPDVFHFNDWQSAYGPPYLEIIYRHHPDFKSTFKQTGTVMTVHNLAYQGLTRWGLSVNKDNPIVPLFGEIFPEHGLFIGVYDHGYTYEVDAFGITGFPRYFQFMELGGAECWSDAPGCGGRHNILKFGLEKVNKIIAVSRGNRNEIQRHDLGFGLGEIIAGRAAHGAVTQVWNGVDENRFNPWNLSELNEWVDKGRCIRFVPFGADDQDLFEKKVQNKTALKAKLNKLVQRYPETCFGRLDEGDAGDVLVSGISRLVRQKGYGILFEPLDFNDELDIHFGERLIDVLMRLRSERGKRLQFVIMGTPGDAHGGWVAARLESISKQYEGRMIFLRLFDSSLANQVRAGSDVFFMPSEYEPGGISNIQAALAGVLCTLPYTGGIIDFFESGGTHSEFVTAGFNYNVSWTVKRTAQDFARTFKRILYLYEAAPEEWQRLVRRAMTLKVDWSYKVPEYLRIYEDVRKMQGGGKE